MEHIEECLLWSIPLTSQEVAEGFLAQLKSAAGDAETHLRSVTFAPDIYDIDVTCAGCSLTLSLARQGESVRLMLDDYVVDSMTLSDAIEFVSGLIAGRASLRVSKSRLFGRQVRVDVQVGSSKQLSATRNFGSGLAEWEERLCDEPTIP